MEKTRKVIDFLLYQTWKKDDHWPHPDEIKNVKKAVYQEELLGPDALRYGYMLMGQTSCKWATSQHSIEEHHKIV